MIGDNNLAKVTFSKISHKICLFGLIGNFSLTMAQSFYQEFAQRLSFKLGRGQ